VAGRVIARADQTPLERARIVLTSPALAEGRVTLSAPDGSYRFEHLPAASYSLTATRSGFAPFEYGPARPGQPDPVSIRAGEALTNVDLALAAAGVIAGSILDEDGKPFAGATLDALAARAGGDQATLVSLATSQSDDRGEFRLTGLPAGRYFVSAFDPAFANVGDQTGPLRYAATYYPGVTSTEQAADVVVTPGAEPTRVTFRLRIVRPATVSGLLRVADGTQLVSAVVTMTPLDGVVVIAMPPHDVTITPDGRFGFRNVPAGFYRIRARGEAGGPPLVGSLSLQVDGRDIDSAEVTLLPGATVAGAVKVQSSGAATPAALRGLRVRAPFSDGTGFGDAVTGDVLPDGSFSISGLMAGSHIVAVEGLSDPWVLKSVTYRGQDVTDSGLEAESRQRLENVMVTITDAASEVSGVVHDAQGHAVPDATVLLVPLPKQFWTRTSRRIGRATTDATGRYRMRGLPEGEYRAVASLWIGGRETYRPPLLQAYSNAGVAVTLGSLETRTLDLPLTSFAGERPPSPGAASPTLHSPSDDPRHEAAAR
jgi:hypothetical protein